MTTQDHPLTRRLVELARRAPSVHNTQPWLWRIRGDTVELWADRDRQLRVADPEGCNLAISCGAALHHVVVAARALGLTPSVELLPRLAENDLLATVVLAAGPPAEDARETLDAIEERHTDRRRFTSWPVPDARLTQLARTGSDWGVTTVPLIEPATRLHTELLLSRAQATQESDRRFAWEQTAWTGRSPTDGVPPSHAAPRSRVASSDRPNRLAPEVVLVSPGALVESADRLLVICSQQDDQGTWLRAGQALSALWLQATRDGLSLVPLSQVIEVSETRALLHHDLRAEDFHPQILVRVGWQEIGRSTLSPTPRRGVGEVLLP